MVPTNLPLILTRNSELCADGRTALSLGGLLIGTEAVRPDDPPAAEAQAAPEMPGLAPVVPLGDAVLDWKRLIGFLDRQPPAALDRMVVTLPTGLVDQLTVAELAGRADHLGLPVQAWVTDLVPAAAEPTWHPVLYLDEHGIPTVAANAVSVRVLPLSGRVDDPYANLPDDVVAQVATLPYPATRMALRDGVVQVGLPPSLVRAFHPDLLDDTAAPATLTGDAALDALGATATEAAGYADVLARLTSLGAGGQAVLEADGTPYLVTRHAGTGALAVLDPATAGPARLPLAATALRVATLPDDGTTLGERMDRVRGPRAADAGERSWTAATAGGVEVLEEWTARDGTRRAVEAIGARVAMTDDVRRLIGKAVRADQNVIVLRPAAAGAPLSGDLIPPVAKRIDQHGWDGLVPAVVNLARTIPAGLLPVLDTFGVDLFEQDPGAETEGMFFLGVPWTVRHPGGGRGPAAEEITEDLLIAAGSARRPPFEPPSLPVASLLAQPLTAPEALRQVFATHGPALTAQRAEVASVAGRVGGYAGHQAILALAEQDRLGPTLNYLGAEHRQYGDVLDPVLGLADAEQVRKLLPHLAVLAGQGLGDPVSRTIVSTIGDLMEARITREAAVGVIHRLAGLLPRTDTGLRVRWTEKLNQLAEQVPDQRDNLTAVIRAVLTCPEE